MGWWQRHLTGLGLRRGAKVAVLLAAGAAVIEPHTGPSNPGASLWASQRPYQDSSLNRVSTHGAAPDTPNCGTSTMPAGEGAPNFKNQFQTGEQVITLAAYRDQGRGQQTTYRIRRPNSTVWQEWTHAMNDPQNEYYAGAYWYWTWTLPQNAENGQWQFEATYQGKTMVHPFTVGSTTTAIADMRGLIGAWFDPATSGQGFELHWINGNYALLFFYGHHDDGENFFLLGERLGGWDFGQEVEFSLYATQGGTWNNFNPANITRPTWGTLRITFVDCENAVADLDGADGTKTMTLERLGRTEGLDCGG